MIAFDAVRKIRLCAQDGSLTMKFLILLVCLGFVAADLHKRAAPLVDDAVLAFKEGMGKAGSLRQALGMPEATELDQVEEDVKEEVVKKLREKLYEILEKIKNSLQEKKEVLQAFWEKLKELREKLKDMNEGIGEKGKELVQKIKEKLREVFKKILEKFDKRNLDEEYDVLARSKFRDLIEKIKDDFLNNETFRKMREYVKNFVTNKPILQEFKEFLLKLKETDFKQLIRDLFEHRRESRAEKGKWDQIKDFFKDLKENFKEKFSKLVEWLKKGAGEGFAKLKEKYGTIKALCLDVIAHAKDIHGEVARETIEFFRPYKEDMGSLWKTLVESLNDHIGSF